MYAYHKKNRNFSVQQLFELAGNSLNRLPEPASWSWTESDVANWVQNELNLPRYAEIFKANKIDGKKLIFMDCQTLNTLHITDFDHMKYIAMNVRHLYGLPPDTELNRRIGGRRNIHDVYSQYYKYLASGQKRMSLFDYMLSVRLVTRHPQSPEKILFGRLSDCMIVGRR